MKRRILCLLLAVLLILPLTLQAPSAGAVVNQVYKKGTVKLSSLDTNSTLMMTGDTTLKVDIDRNLYGILGDKTIYNLTIEGDGTHQLSISGWENLCMDVKNLTLKNVDMYCIRNGCSILGSFLGSHSTFKIDSGKEDACFVAGSMSFSNSTITITSDASGLEVRGPLSLTDSTLNAGGRGAFAVSANRIGGTNYHIVARGGTTGLISRDQTSHLYQCRIDAQGTKAALDFESGNMILDSDVGILHPKNCTTNGRYIVDQNGNIVKWAIIGDNSPISGSVTIDAPNKTCHGWLYARCTGQLSEIDDDNLIITWQRSSNGTDGWVNLADQGYTNHPYACGVEDVDKYIRVMVEPIGYAGVFYSDPVKITKDIHTGTPEKPELTYRGGTLTVLNAIQGQEYFSSSKKLNYVDMKDIYWATARQPAEGQKTLSLPSTPDKVYYVYTRYAETDAFYASNEFSVSSIECTSVYSLAIGGTQVDGNNLNDILGDGKFSYDPEANELLVKGSYTCNGLVVENRIPDLTIRTDGDWALKSNQATAVWSDADLFICGEGSLLLYAPNDCGIQMTDNTILTIEDTTLTASGQWGIVGSAHGGSRLEIYYGEIIAKGTEGAVMDFNDGYLLRNTVTLLPANVQYIDGSVCDANGIVALQYHAVPVPYVYLTDDSEAFVGSTLTVDADQMASENDRFMEAYLNGDYTYQWYADDDPIYGETSETLALTEAYLGKYVYVRIAYGEGIVIRSRPLCVEEKGKLNNPFVDVPEYEYYYDAVLWAVNHAPQITTGTDDTHFSPEETCTRAQVVTFLWRTQGRPEPTQSSNPFKDVPDDEYYYKAVLWAVEKGITTGTDYDLFSPDDKCTRAQVVTFLWRAAGKPFHSQSSNPFKDVPGDEYYYNAVLWAVEKGITTGTDPDRFSPDDSCTRAQVVTFLYRAQK